MVKRPHVSFRFSKLLLIPAGSYDLMTPHKLPYTRDNAISLHALISKHLGETAWNGSGTKFPTGGCLAPLLCTTLLQSFWHRWSHI